VLLDYQQVAAVNARLELDLRIGAAFTRFQTMTLQRRIEQIATEEKIISYGTLTNRAILIDSKDLVNSRRWDLSLIDGGESRISYLNHSGQ
jgi:hypothetical protein